MGKGLQYSSGVEIGREEDSIGFRLLLEDKEVEPVLWKCSGGETDVGYDDDEDDDNDKGTGVEYEGGGGIGLSSILDDER